VQARLQQVCGLRPAEQREGQVEEEEEEEEEREKSALFSSSFFILSSLNYTTATSLPLFFCSLIN